MRYRSDVLWIIGLDGNAGNSLAFRLPWQIFGFRLFLTRQRYRPGRRRCWVARTTKPKDIESTFFCALKAFAPEKDKTYRVDNIGDVFASSVDSLKILVVTFITFVIDHENQLDVTRSAIGSERSFDRRRDTHRVIYRSLHLSISHSATGLWKKKSVECLFNQSVLYLPSDGRD